MGNKMSMHDSLGHLPTKMEVVLLFQGADGNPIRDAIASHLRSHPEEIGARFGVTLVSEGAAHGASPIHQRVRQQLAQADAAVAILSKDERPASTAGNLWYEIGLWYGLKERAQDPAGASILLLIDTDDEREKDPAWPVDPPTDLHGLVWKRVSSPDDAVVAVQDFCVHLMNRRPSSAPDTEASRVRAIIGHGRDTWSDDLRTHCSTAEAECDFRAASSALLAELARALDAKRSIARLVELLGRIARRCNDLVVALKAPGDVAIFSHRRDSLAALDRAVSELEHLAAVVHEREFSTDPTDPRRDPLTEVLPEFISELVRGSSLLTTPGEDEPTFLRQAKRLMEDGDVQAFCDWAGEVLHGGDSYSNSAVFQSDAHSEGSNEFDRLSAALFLQSTRAASISEVVARLTRAYFDGCVDGLLGAFESGNHDGDRVADILRSARQRLPHNDDSTSFPYSAWARAETVR